MKSIFHDGVQVSLDHLAPTAFSCPCPQIRRDLAIGVSFSNHCYTEKFDDQLHSKEHIVVYEGNERARVFCPIRHGLSYRLPEIVCSLPGKKVFQTAEQRNYVYSVTLETAHETYEVFFMLQRAEKIPGLDLRLTVESAYPVVNPTPRLHRPRAIRFAILAHKILMRQPIRFAPR